MRPTMEPPDPFWSGCEENHAFRSHVIQWLLHQSCSGIQQEPNCEYAIPRVLIQYWHDLDALPEDVAQCLQSWKQLESHGFVVQLFDDKLARVFINENFDPQHVTAFDRCYHPAMRCDYFRLCYILKCGGFYVDADEVYRGTGWEELFSDEKLKIQPLCYDTSTNEMVKPEDFLCDASFPSSRIFYINNNPLIAPPSHPLLRIALLRSTKILLSNTAKPEIQSTTGPGNLSASLVRHAADLQLTQGTWDFTILRDWPSISECRWFLSYRNDDRNWRYLNSTSGD